MIPPPVQADFVGFARKLRRIVLPTIVFVGVTLATDSAYSQFVLTPTPGLPGVSAGSVAWGDYDNDGRLDFLLSGSLELSLWRNTGSGFSNVTASVAPGLPGLYDSSLDWGDYDNDGRLDLLITGLTNFSGGAVSQVWRNTGSQFTNVPIPGLLGLGESSAEWCDFDGDGRLDFLIAGTSDGTSSGAIAQLWRNTGSGFTNVPIPELPGNFDNSLAWADFDNDGRLDFLIAGTISGGTVSQLWRNSLLSSNSPPAAPTDLSATVSGTTVALKWSPPGDDHTPAAGLSYDVRMGTTPGGVDILSPEVDPATGWRRVATLGNLGENPSATFHLPPGHYYWSVQAVDPSFAGSRFATEQQFGTSPLLFNPVRQASGVFEFDFTNRTALSFDVLVSTNIMLASTNWTNLGPASSLGGGLYRFTDAGATSQPQRFYLLREQ